MRVEGPAVSEMNVRESFSCAVNGGWNIHLSVLTSTGHHGCHNEDVGGISCCGGRDGFVDGGGAEFIEPHMNWALEFFL